MSISEKCLDEDKWKPYWTKIFYLDVQVKRKLLFFRHYDDVERFLESVFPLTQMVYI